METQLRTTLTCLPSCSPHFLWISGKKSELQLDSPCHSASHSIGHSPSGANYHPPVSKFSPSYLTLTCSHPHQFSENNHSLSLCFSCLLITDSCYIPKPSVHVTESNKALFKPNCLLSVLLGLASSPLLKCPLEKLGVKAAQKCNNNNDNILY